MTTAFRQETEDDFHPLDEPSQESTAHEKQSNQNDDTYNRQHSYLLLFLLFLQFSH